MRPPTFHLGFVQGALRILGSAHMCVIPTFALVPCSSCTSAVRRIVAAQSGAVAVHPRKSFVRVLLALCSHRHSVHNWLQGRPFICAVLYASPQSPSTPLLRVAGPALGLRRYLPRPDHPRRPAVHLPGSISGAKRRLDVLISPRLRCGCRPSDCRFCLQDRRRVEDINLRGGWLRTLRGRGR